MDEIEKLVAELHDIVSAQLTLHTEGSVKALLEDVRIKADEIEKLLEALDEEPVPEAAPEAAPADAPADEAAA